MVIYSNVFLILINTYLYGAIVIRDHFIGPTGTFLLLEIFFAQLIANAVSRKSEILQPGKFKTPFYHTRGDFLDKKFQILYFDPSALQVVVWFMEIFQRIWSLGKCSTRFFLLYILFF